MTAVFNKYDIYTDCGSLYCYKDSNVLRNRYDIHEYEKLKAVEQDIVAVKQQHLLTYPITGRFTTNHLCRIHSFSFGDVYPFSGHLRRETINKGTTTFLNENQIAEKLKSLTAELVAERYLDDLNGDNWIIRMAYFFAELNYIHPFREGNGRSTREFMLLLIERHGYRVNWTSAGVDALMKAMEESVYDSAALVPVLRECIKKE